MKAYVIILRGLFNDAVSSSGYIASDERMINEWYIGKGMERGGSGEN
jgi:hypothetical protein